MFRFAAALVVLTVSMLPATALACGMYMPREDVNLADVLGDIDDAKPEVVAPEVVNVDVAVPVDVPAVAEVAPMKADPEPAFQPEPTVKHPRKGRPNS